MKNFDIEVISKKPEKINKRLMYKGRITISDLQETFYMPLNSWTIDQYKQQWKEGLERIKTNDVSCIVVSIAGLNKNPWIQLWTLYKANTTIFIQNQYLFYEIFQKRAVGLPPYDAKTCYQYLLPRRTLSDNGRKISEWQIDINDILEL